MRYGWNIQQGSTGKSEVGGDLAVIRLGKSRRDTCVVAWVDTIANKDALALARNAAERAASHICGGKPAPYLGARSK